MTKVTRLYEEEKVNQVVNKAVDDTSKQIAKKLIEINVDMIDIMQATGLTKK